MNKTVRNEHKKLLATWYNNFSIAILVVGFLTPLWTIIYGTAQTIPDQSSRTLGFFICVILGVFLLGVARTREFGRMTNWQIFALSTPAIIVGVMWLQGVVESHLELSRSSPKKASAFAKRFSTHGGVGIDAEAGAAPRDSAE